MNTVKKLKRPLTTKEGWMMTFVIGCLTGVILIIIIAVFKEYGLGKILAVGTGSGLMLLFIYCVHHLFNIPFLTDESDDEPVDSIMMGELTNRLIKRNDTILNMREYQEEQGNLICDMFDVLGGDADLTLTEIDTVKRITAKMKASFMRIKS